MAEQKFYKVICNEINLVLLLKKLTMREERRTYHDVKKKIEGLDKPITIDSYITFVVKAFLYDAEEFFNNLPQDKEDKDTITRAVYASIIEAYPPFDLEFVCADINNGTFMEEMHESLAAVLSTAAQAEAPPKSLKAIKTLNDVNNLERYLSKNLIGQEQAVKGLVDSMKLVASGLYKNASFFFIGPTGVGKTELARLVGNRYSGNFWKVNCAEYAQAHEYAKLIGSPPGYVGHSEKSLMAEKAEKSNKWVILFDEIEKAHTKFYDFLLSLLDDGTCTDNMGQVLDFSQSIFIFTSNQGVTDINRNPMGFDRSEEVEQDVTDSIIRNSVKKHFSPEFLNRIDDIVVFNSLSKAEVREIAQLQLEDLPIKATDPLIDFIVDNGFSA